MRNLPLACWMIGFLVAVPAPSPSLAQDTGAAVLDGIPALARKIDLNARDESLDGLLGRLSDQLGVRLSADGRAVDLKVSASARQVGAAQLLALLAEQQDLRWERRGEALTLVQTDAAAKRDANAGTRAADAAWEYLRELFKRVTSAPPPAEQEARPGTDEFLAAVDPALARTVRLRALREGWLKRDGADPKLRRVAELFAVLSDAQTAQVRSGVPLVLDSTDASLPAGLRRQVKEFVESIVGTAPPREPPQPPPAGDGSEGRTVTFDFSRRPTLLFSRPGLNAEPEPTRLWVRLARWRKSGSGSKATAFSEWTHRGPDSPAPLSVSRQEWPGPLNRPVNLQALQQGVAPLVTVPLSSVAHHLGEQLGWTVVADSFARLQLRTLVLSRAGTLGAVLSTLEGSNGVDWELRGPVLMLRSARRSEDRAAEVAPSRLKPLQSKQPLPVEEYLTRLGTLVAALDQEQISGLHQAWNAYMAGSLFDIPLLSTGPLEWHWDLRLWESLSAPLRARLWKGDELTEMELAGAALLRWTSAAERPAREVGALAWRVTPLPKPLAGARLVLRREPMVIRVEIKGNSRRSTLMTKQNADALVPSPECRLLPVEQVEFIYGIPGRPLPVRTGRVLIPRGTPAGGGL